VTLLRTQIENGIESCALLAMVVLPIGEIVVRRLAGGGITG